MDIEAILIIGTLAAILGIILLLLSLWIAKRRVKKKPEDNRNIKITKVGWVFLIILLSALFGGFGAQYIFPSSLFAEYVVGFWGVTIWWIAITLISVAIVKSAN